MVEARDLRGHVERGGVVEELGEVERAREAVMLARVLDQLDELLVERELAPRDVVRRQLVAEAVAQDVEEHAFAGEAADACE